MTECPFALYNATFYSETDIRYRFSQFNSKFPKDEDCQEELYRHVCDTGLIRCKKCGKTSFSKSYGNRVLKCLHCRSSQSFTSGTFFHKMRHFRVWLFLIDLLGQGIRISADMFHRVVGNAYGSAWVLFKKFELLIEEKMHGDAASVPTSVLMQLVCKRSRETPARCHPTAEQEDSQRKSGGPDHSSRSNGSGSASPSDANHRSSTHGTNRRSANSQTSQTKVCFSQDDLAQRVATLSGLEKEVYDLLGDELLHFDDLIARTGSPAGLLSSALVMLQLDQVVERFAGDQYARVRAADEHADDDVSVEQWSESPADKPTSEHGDKAADGETHNSGSADMKARRKAKIARFVKTIQLQCHGISRKYFQLYLASFWCCDDRDYWESQSLILAGFEVGPVTREQILAYVTPPEAKIMI